MVVTLESIVSGLLDSSRQVLAVSQLATMVDEVEGEKAAKLGRCIRDFGALPELLFMLHRPETTQARHTATPIHPRSCDHALRVMRYAVGCAARDRKFGVGCG